ncbi:hypothetical protein ACQUSY_01160 [Microbacterium sp. YY-03]|uniref:hypothetical protein n=1 Tax=Microbacterium sp. YY-03 TaxID=3421636 RepID=UPI003D17B74C
MLPDIHTWWPQLSIEAKHAIWESPNEAVPASALEEIRTLTGYAATGDETLSDDDRQFIETQREPVD